MGFQEARACAPEASSHPRSHSCWVTASLPGLAVGLGEGSWNDHLVHAWSPPVKPTPAGHQACLQPCPALW